jgi:hypothetical protein
MKRVNFIFVAAVFVSAFSSCAPTLYLIDRPTILEEQAAGEWIDLEKETETAILRNKPEPLPPSAMGRGGERVLSTLPGEPMMTSQSQSPKE